MTAPFSCPIRPENVGELIDLTVPDKSSTVSMAELQLEGVAALYNILCEHPVAYLADEVGMGKTYQALALAAVLWNERPDARILFISPRQNLQQKWLHEYDRFFASNYRRQQGIGDDRVSSLLFGRPIHRPMGFDNLRGWIPTIGMPEPVAPFLRHTSFTRPVFLSSRDFDDMDELWETTEARFRGWGLFGVRRPRRLDAQNASRELNCAFATALNAKLEAEAGGRPYFDLVVVDEAQCLRNPENQTNLVLSQVLRRQVGRWLFMSATPAHGGPADLPTTLNHYPGRGTLIEPGLAEDLPALQHALQPLMIRRQRQYLTRNEAKVGKQQYRKHDKEQWAVRDDAMSVLGTLSMGLMQKGLVDVLQGRSNRFRIGFLSSFESLQSSLQGSTTTSERLADETHDDAGLDWHRDQTSGVEPNDAPDASFVQAIDADFRRAFGRPLPHPKIDAVVDRVARAAFGTDQCLGGRKFLIFTRRVSTVDTLRDRLTRRYLESVAARIRRCWDPEFAWDTIDADDNPLRRAMADQGWLNRYRETFRASGRNATFFEDGWLLRLCRAGGVSPEAASQNISERLWAESWTHASRSAGERRQQHRADRIRYLALHAVRREPQAFGLTPDSAKPWRVAYEAALHEHFEQAPPDPDPHVAPELFEGTFWTAWDDHFAGQSLALPAREPASADDLHQRQVVRTLLAQTFRLTDTLLDLYYAEEDAQQNAGAFATRFLEWLSSNDPSASRLREECAEWLQHLSLIVESSLDGAGKPWAELARRETWPELFNLAPVVGVTGGSGAHQSATRQFRTPSLPRVIVCTDTLKEGVDLHLFCDQVLHYGVAWTSGDLEQRVGRVDRYFSRIERRLAIEGPPPEVELHVGYPHVLSSLERGQVDRVIERQREAERLMDSPSPVHAMRTESCSSTGRPQSATRRYSSPIACTSFREGAGASSPSRARTRSGRRSTTTVGSGSSRAISARMTGRSPRPATLRSAWQHSIARTVNTT